jgi:CheY-like chemotaxis protein
MATLAQHLAAKSFLLLDDSPHQRRLAAEVMRAAGATRLVQSASVPEALEAMRSTPVDVVMTDWQMAPVDGLTFTRAIRRGDYFAGMRRLPIILITSRMSASDIEEARLAGVDEYLAKPFTTAGLLERLNAVFFHRRPFIDSNIYCGPCRRRKTLPEYSGPKRRLFDEEASVAEGEVAKLKRQLAQVKLARASALMKEFKPGDRLKIRETFLAAQDVEAIARELNDALMLTAATSLLRYIKAVGASPRFDAKVIEAHAEALSQIISLPDLPASMRERVREALTQLVAKKLERASQERPVNV